MSIVKGFALHQLSSSLLEKNRCALFISCHRRHRKKIRCARVDADGDFGTMHAIASLEIHGLPGVAAACLYQCRSLQGPCSINAAKECKHIPIQIQQRFRRFRARWQQQTWHVACRQHRSVATLHTSPPQPRFVSLARSLWVKKKIWALAVALQGFWEDPRAVDTGDCLNLWMVHIFTLRC